MSEYQGEKFKQYLRKNFISVDKAASLLGKNRVTVYQYFKSANLSRDVVSNILSSFGATEDEIWSNGRTGGRLEAVPIGLADPDGFDATGEKIYELPDGSKIMEVKIVEAKAYAGYLRGFPDPEFYEDLPTLKVSVNKYHKGTYLAFEVKGDSMVPSDPKDFQHAVLEGWYVIGREVQRHHWSFKLHTHNNSKWVIVHKKEGILVKQIINHDVELGTITVHSLNPKYEDETFSLDDIELIFNVVKIEIKER